MQIAQHHFNCKTIYKKQRTAGEMLHPKPTDLEMTKKKKNYEKMCHKSDLWKKIFLMKW